MSTRKLLIVTSLILAVAVFAWTSGDALAQTTGTKDATQQQGTADAAKGKVTRDDVARYLGKVTPSEQEAAVKRNRQLGLLPGVAGLTAQAPEAGETR